MTVEHLRMSGRYDRVVTRNGEVAVYDVCIIGAGPAGSTVARLAPPGLRVLLVDRRRLDQPYSGQGPAKLCGGLLAPAAQRELARQGLGVPAHVLEGPQLFAVRAVDHGSSLSRRYQRFYTNTDREAFDRWLASLVPDRVDRLFGYSAVKLDTRQADLTQLWLRGPNGESASVCARVVVGADGASSLVRSMLAGPADRLPYVAVQGSFESVAEEPCYGAFFDNELTDFYGWTIPKGREVSVGLALQRGRDARAVFDAFVEQVRATGTPIGQMTGLGSAPVRRPLRTRDVVLGRNGLACVGEAAGLVSASSAEGISYALRSGEALAAALRHGIEGVGARYRSAVAPVVAQTIGTILKARLIYAPHTRVVIMRSGIGALRSDEPEPVRRTSHALLGGPG